MIGEGVIVRGVGAEAKKKMSLPTHLFVRVFFMRITRLSFSIYEDFFGKISTEKWE